jgi:hypothetical protein
MLAQLEHELFYLNAHQQILAHLLNHKSALQPVDLVQFADRLRTAKALDECGGLAGLSALMDAVPSAHNFPHYLDVLRFHRKRRKAAAIAAKLSQSVRDASPERLEELLTESREAIASTAGTKGPPLIEFLSVKQLKAFEPNPATYLVGNDMISKGAICVLAGVGGLGKSRLATTLAFSGAIGRGRWMGYEVRRQFRTAILQSENSKGRSKSEVMEFPDEVDDWIRISAPADLAFTSSGFRSALRAFYESWPFDVLVIDPWMDIAADGEQSDTLDAFRSILSCLPKGDEQPAIVIVAHTRKMGRTDKWVPKRGRELAAEVSGSHAVVSKSRVAFFLQPATLDPQDDRVIFDCGKANNSVPNPPSCWRRTNGQFEPVESFDWEAYYNPPDDSGRNTITRADMKTAFLGSGKRLAARSVIVAQLMEAGFSQGAAYNAMNPSGKFAEYLRQQGEGRSALFSWVDESPT